MFSKNILIQQWVLIEKNIGLQIVLGFYKNVSLQFDFIEQYVFILKMYFV